MPSGFYPVVYSDSEYYTFIAPNRTFRPYVVARMTNPATGIATERRALVDSGADLCAIPTATAQILGIDLTQCRRGESDGSGGRVETYYTELEITACGISQLCPVLIPVRLTGVLLGRDPFFRLVHFGFAEELGPSVSRFYWRVP